MIAIIDYKAGNQTSVLRALEFLNIEARITDDDDTIMKAHGVIFPGVGAAKQAMDRLMQNKQDELLKTLAANHKPLLGICLGCQILLEHSEETIPKHWALLKAPAKNSMKIGQTARMKTIIPKKSVFRIWAGTVSI